MFTFNRIVNHLTKNLGADESKRKRRSGLRGKSGVGPRLRRFESLERREMMSATGDWFWSWMPPSTVPQEPTTLAPTAAEVAVADPVGDAYDNSPFADMKGLSVTERSTDLLFRLDFADEAKSILSGMVEGVHASILLDLDGNRQTPVGANAAEGIINIDVSLFGYAVASYSGPQGSHDLTAQVEGSSVSVALPRDLLPANLGNLEVAAVSSLDMSSAGRDRTPNAGYLNVASGQVRVDNRGLSLPAFSWQGDPAGDGDRFADLKGIEAEVVGEHLVLRNYYNHRIEPNDLYDVCCGTIDIDVDGDILTGMPGLTEGSNSWPTFGVDVRLDYYLYPRMLGGEVEAALTAIDPPDRSNHPDRHQFTGRIARQRRRFPAGRQLHRILGTALSPAEHHLRSRGDGPRHDADRPSRLCSRRRGRRSRPQFA